MLSRSRTVPRVLGGLSASICFPDSRTRALQTKETLLIACCDATPVCGRVHKIAEDELQGQTSLAVLDDRGGAMQEFFAHTHCGPVSMPPGKESQRVLPSSLGEDTRGGGGGPQ